jgi:hypothetical protein
MFMSTQVKTCDCAVLAEQLRQTQAQLAELIMRVNAIENRAGVAPPSAASIGVDVVTEASAAATTNDRPAASMMQVRASSE